MYDYREQMRQVISDALGQFGSPKDIGRITADEALKIWGTERGFVSRVRTAIVGRIIDTLGLEKKGVLEVGSGTGDFYRLIQGSGKRVNITLSDINVGRVKKHVDDEIPVIELDLDRLNLPDYSQKLL